SNHNGQLTNQVGIHAFWESRLPELFSSNYNFIVGKANYIENPLKEAWKILKHTHSLVDTVLIFEAQLAISFPSDKKYSFSERNNTILKQYSTTYSKAYHDKLAHMVEKQMRSAILEIGSFWYSAWVDAGQPELKNLIKIDLEPDEKKMDNDAEQKYQKGIEIGREL
ncbi:MAG: S1/P1 Nuclease, partial [Pedobacter sp.]